MTVHERQRLATSIDPATEIGVVALTVADLDRAIKFYTEAIGFAVLVRSGRDATLGAAGTPVLLLHEQRGILPWMVDASTGLYHFAILVPSRPDLGCWLRHYLTTNYPPPGQGDHIVSEAFYLRDPDGHGIEVYRDRPREGWVWENGRVKMGGGPIDIRSMLAEGDAVGEHWSGMSAGTRLGHIHLQVGDIAEAERFYHEILGFDVVAQMDTALFVSAGGYHHHLGMNTWHSQGAAPAPDDTATLRFFTITLPNDQARVDVAARLAAADIPYQETVSTIAVRDPWQNTVLLHTGSIADAGDAAALLAGL